MQSGLQAAGKAELVAPLLSLRLLQKHRGVWDNDVDVVPTQLGLLRRSRVAVPASRKSACWERRKKRDVLTCSA
jgi:hypothetical protein